MECLKWFTMLVLACAAGLLLALAVSSPPVRAYSTYPAVISPANGQTPRGRASERVRGVEGLETRTERERGSALCR